MKKQQFLDDLILVSSSKSCITLLKQINIKPGLFLTIDINENPLKGEFPKDYSLRTTKNIAKKIQILNPNCFILVVNKSVACGRRILLKTKNIKIAEKYIRLLSGRRHKIYTSICLLTPSNNKQHIKTVITVIKFKRLNEQEIKYYLLLKEWKNNSGIYNIQGFSGAFILFLKGSYSSTIGLPLYQTYCLLSNYFKLNLLS